MKKKSSKKRKSAPHFSYEERVKIEILLNEKISKRDIARRLGREPSSIRYEINRNSVRGKYRAEKADFKAYQRRWRAKWQVLKIAMDAALKKYVNDHVRMYWSPEAIAGRLKYVDTHLSYVGKDAIYSYLESPHGRTLERYLWWKGKKHKARTPRVTIDGRTMIDRRPKHVENRRLFGHWEGDFIVSGKGGSGALLVLVERKSRYCIIRKLADRKISTVNAVLASIFGSGQLVIDSLTIDNDISFRKHEEMSVLIGAPVFFCHPYHSWEKGSVEKLNQLIRRFIPKRSDISNVTTKRVAEVERILNNRPLKCLQFLTPREKLARSKRLKAFVVESSWSNYYEFTNHGWVK